MIRETNFTHPKVDYEDKYTPFLYHLRDKYSNRFKNITETHENYAIKKAEFENFTKSFNETSGKLVQNFDEALNTLKEFSSATTLKQPSEIKESFELFKTQNYPKLTVNEVQDVTSAYLKFKEFCVTDLFGSKCLFDRKNQTEFINDFEQKFTRLREYDLTNVTKVYSMDLIAVVKDVKNSIQTARDVMLNEDITSNFDGLTDEYLIELQHMNSYLQNKKPIKVSDFENKNDTKATNIVNFERDFKNLILSTKFICHNIKKPFFLPE